MVTFVILLFLNVFVLGLPLRKVVFSALLTIVTTGVAAEHADLAELTRQVAQGIVDEYDAQALAFNVLTQIALLRPQKRALAMLPAVDVLPGLIMKIVKQKLQEAKKHDERALDLLYLLVRCMFAIHRLPGVVQACPKFHDFYTRILATSSLKPMVARVTEEMK